MPYFEELQELPVYVEAEGDFRFRYNENSGGGQAFLAGKFKNKDGQLTSPIALDGKTAVFKYVFKALRQGEAPVIMNDDDVMYDIKPRSASSTSMKLGVEGKTNPSKALTAFFMLPEGCGVGNSNDLNYSVLAKGNHWLQSMRLACEEDASQPNTVYLIPSDLVFSGGNASARRFFRLDCDRRIRDIIAVSKNEGLPDSVRQPLLLFAEIYSGTRPFSCEEAEKAADTLMRETAQYFPTRYSGIDDPLPVLASVALSQTQDAVRFNTGLVVAEKRNIVIFGAPGTGKSRLLDQMRAKLLEDGGEFERVTFHPDYSYAHFVGAYKPVPAIDGQGNEAITYKYVPGPFMRVLAKALRNGKTSNVKPHLLLIEEINRASATAVFGDVFQLLDRSRSNFSEYSIHPAADVRNYLAETVGGRPTEYEELRLPDNMFIWASMNSADQGVFPIDTAFKRRWDFIYVGIDKNDADLVDKLVTLGRPPSEHTIEWNALRKSINDFLAVKGINEDKQIGPYFLSREVSVPEKGVEIDRTHFVDAFKQKVIMYLFEDAARQHRSSVFEGCKLNHNRYSDICSEFDRIGMHVFNPAICGRVQPRSYSGVQDHISGGPLGTDSE
jgi:hypothetical protein